MTALEQMHTLLPAEEARRVKLAAGIVRRFAAADAAGKRAISAEAEGVLGKGWSYKSICRKVDQFAALEAREAGSGWRALVDGRTLAKAEADGLALNAPFVAHFHELCLANRRCTEAAIRCLHNELFNGVEIPGVGTWRDVYALEHGVMPAEDNRCVYAEGDLPRGWSARNLRKLAPKKHVLVAARTGLGAAKMDFAPVVHRTRQGLLPCEVVMIDDMWYEHKVEFHWRRTTRRAQRVVEFALMDALTGKIVSRLTKPVLEKDDGTRETLRGEWTKFLVAHLLCEVGYPKRGCLILGEHGTASADQALRATLAELTGGSVAYDARGRVAGVVDGAVRFEAGGIVPEALAKGLYRTPGKGNPRTKGLLEGFHALIKNELGGVRGHVGGGRGRQPEAVYGMDQEDDRLRAIVAAVSRQIPDIREHLRYPYLPYFDYLALVDAAYARLERRTEHQMEGWEACGFVTAEFKPMAGANWMPVKEIPENQVQHFNALIRSGDLPYRTRRMSPIEAWTSRRAAAADELTRLGDFAVPLILGPSLAVACTVDDHLEMKYANPTTLAECRVSAMLAGGTILQRGAVYSVYVNPLTPEKAFVCDVKGRFLGVAKVSAAPSYADKDAQIRELGARQAYIADLRRELQPIINRELREANARAAENVRALGGADPAALAAAREALAHERRMALAHAPAAAIADDDLLPEAREEAAAISDDDLL